MDTVILVVEDEPLVGLEIQEQLERSGYRIPLVVQNGSDALAAVNSIKPDLIMMDIRIAGNIDGVETARLIRREHNIPLLYLTAFSDKATIERAAATEPDGYLIKPFSERELLANIHLALEKHRLKLLDGRQLASYVPVIDALESPTVLFDTSGRIFHLNIPALLILGMPDSSGFGGQCLVDLVESPREDEQGISEGLYGLRASLIASRLNRLRLENLRDRTGLRRGLIGFIEPISADENSIVNNSLQTAAQALERLIPPDGSLRPVLDHASFLLACPSGSGDLADIFHLAGSHYAFYSMDVMGHGTLPSLIAYSLHDRIRLIAQNLAQNPNAPISPLSILAALNRRYQAGSDTGTFFTIAMCVIDIQSGEWALARAGHSYSMLNSVQGDSVIIQANGMALGAFDLVQLEESRGTMEAGDRMILCSDGLLEILSPKNPEGGYQVIDQFAKLHREDPPALLASALRLYCSSHAPIQNDDASLIVVEFTGKRHPSIRRFLV